MIRFTRTAHFIRAYKQFVKKNPQRAEVLIRAIDRLQNNPRHPGLHTEKLQNSEFWTVRIDRGNRIFFIRKEKDTILLVDVGKHDKYRQY